MDEQQLIKILKRQTKATLIELLHSAYRDTDTQQKRYIFGDLIKASKPSKTSGKDVVKESKAFYKASLEGAYYAPFDINSKNFSDIPEETDEWFAILGDLLESSAQLTKQGDHSNAVTSFAMLYELIDKMGRGEEIVFADEMGSWMIRGDEKAVLHCYILSSAAIMTPEDYTQTVIPLIARDSHESFCNKVYSAAIRHSNKDQRKYLKEQIKLQDIRIKPKR